MIVETTVKNLLDNMFAKIENYSFKWWLYLKDVLIINGKDVLIIINVKNLKLENIL